MWTRHCLAEEKMYTLPLVVIAAVWGCWGAEEGWKEASREVRLSREGAMHSPLAAD